jgi:hypothetical protein
MPMNTLVKTVLGIFLGSIASLGPVAAPADSEGRGVITTLDLERSKRNISINTRDLTLTSSTSIHNLDGGSDDPSALALRQPVRYEADDDGRITDLWIYPADAEKRRQLGLGSADDIH